MSKKLFQSKMPPKPKAGMVFCELCNAYAGPNSPCDRTKNGYCQVSRFQAAKDAVEFGMHPSIHTKAKEVQDEN